MGATTRLEEALVTVDLQLALLGLIAGGAYALAAVGLVAIYKGSGVLNFAQGAVGMVGTEIYGHWVYDGHEKWLGAAIGVLVSAAIGALIHLLITSRLRRAPALAKTVATIGMLLLLQGLAFIEWGDGQITIPQLFSANSISISSSIQLPISGIWTVGIALVLAIAYWLFFTRTTVGLATEAASASEPSAQRFGHRVQLLALLNWTLGSGAAGLAGIIIVGQIGLSPTTLTLVVLQAMVAAVVGRFRRIAPAFVVAIILGVVQSVLVGKTTPGWSEALPFFIIVVVMLVAGQLVPARGQIVERLPAAPFPRLRPHLIVAGVLVFGVLPAILTTYWEGVMVYACAYSLVTLSLVLVTGYLGQISLAQFALAGFGGFTAGAVASDWGWPMLAAIAFAAALAFPLGIAVGYPALRVRGLSLAVLTLAAGTAIHGLYIEDHWGISDLVAPPPDLFGVTLGQEGFLYFACALVAIAALGIWFLRRSTFGKQMVAIRASERAAQSIGIQVQWVKLMTFGVASSLAAVGGALFVFQTSNVSAESFDVTTGVTLLASAFILGIGVVSGGIAAGLFAGFGTPLLVQVGVNANWFAVISGVGLILTVIQHPDGVALFWWSRSGRWRSRRTTATDPAPAGVNLSATPEVKASAKELS
jgi:branched-subunit amino acid ABC-type transport system permease component